MKAVQRKPTRPSLKSRGLVLPQDISSSSSSLPSKTREERSRARRVPLLPPNTNLRTRGSPPFKRRTGKEEENRRIAPTLPKSRTRMPPTEGGIEDVPGGRLQLFQEAWEDAPASTQTIIKRVFHWEWISNPPALTTPKLMAGAPDLGEEVSKLLQKGVIYQVPLQPCFSANLFSVPKASGGSRPIIDLSRLNKFIKAPHFSMTNHNTLQKLITEAVWGASLDLQDAYLHVPIRKNLHKFMAFSHSHQLYFFKVLPFGLNVAPIIFTKILKHPLSRLHQEGIPVQAYLDDWITWAPNKIVLQINLCKILSTLENLGFLINYEKSQLTPASDLTWLGVRWQTP